MFIKEDLNWATERNRDSQCLYKLIAMRCEITETLHRKMNTSKSVLSIYGSMDVVIACPVCKFDLACSEVPQLIILCTGLRLGREINP